MAENLELERDLAARLHVIGIPADLRGYYYLKEAIKIVAKDEQAIFDIMKKVYEPVAAQFNVTAKHVSKAMARAVETGWDRGDLDVLQSYFGYSISNYKGMPTNSEFISILAERIRLQFQD